MITMIVFFNISEPILTQAATSQTVVVTLFVGSGATITVDNTTAPLSTNISLTQNTATASSTFTVSTSDILGYTLKLNATSTPAMQNASSTIPDFGTSPALYSSILPSGQYGFGFSVYSTSSPSDVPTATWGTQTGGCGGGNAPSTSLKYRGFLGASQIIVASSNATTTTSGDVVVVCYVAGQNNAFIPSGSYNATVVATALNN